MAAAAAPEEPCEFPMTGILKGQKFHLVYQHRIVKEEHAKILDTLNLKSYALGLHAHDNPTAPCDHDHMHLVCWFKSVQHCTPPNLGLILGLPGAHVKVIKGKLAWNNAIEYVFKRDSLAVHAGKDSSPEEEAWEAAYKELMSHPSVEVATRFESGASGHSEARRAVRTSSHGWEATLPATSTGPAFSVAGLDAESTLWSPSGPTDLVGVEFSEGYGQVHPWSIGLRDLPGDLWPGFDGTYDWSDLGLDRTSSDFRSPIPRGARRSRTPPNLGEVFGRWDHESDDVRMPLGVSSLPRLGFVEPTPAPVPWRPPLGSTGGPFRIVVPAGDPRPFASDSGALSPVASDEEVDNWLSE